MPDLKPAGLSPAMVKALRWLQDVSKGKPGSRSGFDGRTLQALWNRGLIDIDRYWNHCWRLTPKGWRMTQLLMNKGRGK